MKICLPLPCAVPWLMVMTLAPTSRGAEAGQLLDAATPPSRTVSGAARPQAPASSGHAPDSSSPSADRAEPASQTPPTDAAGQVSPADLEELRRQLDVLAEEIERLRSGEEDIPLPESRRRALGLAPSAATAYRQASGLSFAGYGEMLYENFSSEDERGRAVPSGSQLDFLRLILYSGYRFNDRFVFNSEIELEHANEISVEFAYVDYQATDQLTARAGMVLVPLGLVNEYHEPTVFVGAKRPETEQRIIPTTWRENGAGILGATDRVSYRAYVVNGLDGSGFSKAGFRGGRQKGSRAAATNLALAGRVDVTPTPGIFVGGGAYVGGSGQGLSQGGRQIDARTIIGEVHGQAQVRGFDVRALYARASLDEVSELNAVLSLSGADSIGETMQGGYVQAGYNLLARYASEASAMPYYRYERVDTQVEVPAGFEVDPATDTTFHTVGLELKPIDNIVVKADYQWLTNQAGTGRNQFNLNLGYAF